MKVLTSWQVLLVTIALIIYLNIVFYVARSYHRPRFKGPKKKLSFGKKKAQPEAISEGPEEIIGDDSSNDELGLEES